MRCQTYVCELIQTSNCLWHPFIVASSSISKRTIRKGACSSISRACNAVSSRPTTVSRSLFNLFLPNRLRSPSAVSEGAEQQDVLLSLENEDDDDVGNASDPEYSSLDEGPFSLLVIEPSGTNRRRIVVAISIDASLDAIWSVLTDYENLADFIPGLAVCKVEERWETGARLFQIGEQNLALGLKFKAKCMINVQENPMEVLPSSVCRQIDFEMVEGDFQIFKGSWKMEQQHERDDNMESIKEAVAETTKGTTLTYTLDVQPNLWLPVGLVEGILSKEIQNNLLCVREQVLKNQSLLPGS
ncbi:hypothetical protein KP509_11G004600 [Ceratopteris richardii]|uniref:Coenzyme Q-binding protein COQ10 START domain-containing protein n=1 Tax=Ceratopteris richardii TaxID=49495 RepID=A0A8T2TSH1_CERRI|nr:hypothetical protein KP509_11G004600 [Ceratopteris richardii]KAH7424365.1 hypothetical protein KP509_11G004600 [Ceratopteris richardii]